MKLGAKGDELIKHFEGLRLTSYKCAANVWTIGWGHTSSARPGQTITRARANSLFKQDIAKFEDAVNRLVTVDISQDLFDALVSLAFNIGIGNFEKSTLLKVVNRKGSWSEIAGQFRRWVFGGGRRLMGLVKRREAEAMLAAGLPWKTAGTVTDDEERSEIDDEARGSVEAEWIRHEDEATKPMTNTTVIGSSVAIVSSIGKSNDCENLV
jgi:lysozyme